MLPSSSSAPSSSLSSYDARKWSTSPASKSSCCDADEEQENNAREQGGQLHLWHMCSRCFLFSIDFHVYHNGEDGGPVEAACYQCQGCKGLPQARARLRVVPFRLFELYWISFQTLLPSQWAMKKRELLQGSPPKQLPKAKREDQPSVGSFSKWPGILLLVDVYICFWFGIEAIGWKKETYTAPNHRQLGDQLRGRVAKCLRIKI